ncbi:MAG: efflux RND transporter permease subunit, partial [Planctomycetales bacterium]|nr:efflux RND transporter permease subunit [Planctomycetales bacterium]
MIRTSLQNRLFVIVVALAVTGYGAWLANRLPIDVFPDLNRPRVVIMTEAPGLAPEEVEALITFPLETSLNGAAGVQAVRSSSGVGLSVIYVEFDWDTDIYNDRQVVTERLAVVADQLPPGIKPQLAPISSIMGQIVTVGMFSSTGKTSPMELRTLADWVVRRRLLTIPGVSQVIVMGGERKQYQVLVDPHELLRYGVSLREVETALAESNQNAAGGYLDEQGPNEYLVRSLGRIHTVEDIRNIVVRHVDGQSIRVSQLAEVREGAEVKRGDAAAYTREGDSHAPLAGGPAVLLTINKQPNADTRRVADAVESAVRELASSMPSDVRVAPGLYQQRTFIDLAITNVAEALRDGSILVVLVLLLFLLNVRTTLITLTAIPLSLMMTAVVFAACGLSINTMTLGGLAVAMGELVDDAIVDVENIFRRLRENQQKPAPVHPLRVVFEASSEVRTSIVNGTLIVVMVFLPLFALGGLEGRLFAPLGIAYIVSLVSSLLVSLTVTPVLSYLLLGLIPIRHADRDGFVLRGLKWLVAPFVRFSLRFATPILALSIVAVSLAMWQLSQLERDFLPPFNECAVQVNVAMPAGTSLAKSTQVAQQVDQRLCKIPDIQSMLRKTGRAELDEHAEGVNVSEVIATIDPHAGRSRTNVIDEISAAAEGVPGVAVSVEQPLAHLISHMLSGVKAQVAIKIYGDDLQRLREYADKAAAEIEDVPGVCDLFVEQQMDVPQLRIEADGDRLQQFGLRRAAVNDLVNLAMQGRVVSQVLNGQQSFDLLVRLNEQYREDIDAVRRLAIGLPDGGLAKLENVANVYRSAGPNTISRENVQRRIAVQCNVRNRGLVDAVDEIRQRLKHLESEMPLGYSIEYGGQFASQQSAVRTIGVLFAVALVGMFLVLYRMFGSINLCLQVMMAIPMAFIGAVAALLITGQTLTIASIVGFISLCGIASRNGILLINHYLHL